MDWLQTDLTLLTVDAEHVRCHLTWLGADLEAYPAMPATADVATLLGHVLVCLEHLAQLDALLSAVRSLVA